MSNLFKIAGKILDCYDDPDFISHPLTQQKLGADILDSEQLKRLPDSAFAVKIAGRIKEHRRYPTYNPFITAVSVKYFEGGREGLPKEIEEAAGYHLKTACLKHGIEVPDSLKKYQPVSNEVKFVKHAEDIGTVTSNKSVQMYEERLWQRLIDLQPEDRCRAAEDFCKIAGYDRVTKQLVWDYVPKPVTGPYFEAGIDERYNLLKFAYNAALVSILEGIEESAEIDEPQVLVEKLASLDRMAGFDKRYVNGFMDPYVTVYGGHDLPKIILEKRANHVDMSKYAGPVHPVTGDPVDMEVSKAMSTAQHLAALQRQYPKGSPEYHRMSMAPTNEHADKKYGGNFVKARDIHFSKMTDKGDGSK